MVPMDIKEFPLAWRWIESSHATLPKEILNKLHPLSLEAALRLVIATPRNFPPGATRFDSSGNDEATRHWLKQLSVPEQRVTISWDQDTALSLPWHAFCEYWDDFCYPSSDDADLFLESGQLFLRWNHYEVFEHDSSAL